MQMKKKIFIFGVVLFIVLGAVMITAGQKNSVHQSQKDIYYCPMHPTYTSDHPGDCPICNMKLVKKETSSDKSSEVQSSVKKTENKDICYMHQCPKMHDGKPCPMLVVGKEGEEITCPICKMHVTGQKKSSTVSKEKKEKKILYWTDPMMPGYKKDGPGKSPMGMDVVPVYEEETMPAGSAPSPDGYASILVTPQKQQLIGIKTAQVERKNLTKIIRAAGTIAHDPELYQAQSEYIQAIQAFERSKQSNIPEIVDQSKRLVESTRIRLKHMGLSDDLIDEIGSWKEAEHSLLFAHPGEPVWMYAQIYEYELSLIHIGQELTVDVPSLPGEIFSGKIRGIDPMIDSTTRTTRIRAQLNDPQGHLRPDMYVNASVKVDLGETLVMPSEAIFDTGTKQIVFIDQGEGLLEPRDVILGAKTDGYSEIKSGVSEGEMVVTSSNFLIDSESRLKAALQGMATTHEHAQ